VLMSVGGWVFVCGCGVGGLPRVCGSVGRGWRGERGTREYVEYILVWVSLYPPLYLFPPHPNSIDHSHQRKYWHCNAADLSTGGSLGMYQLGEVGVGNMCLIFTSERWERVGWGIWEHGRENHSLLTSSTFTGSIIMYSIFPSTNTIHDNQYYYLTGIYLHLWMQLKTSYQAECSFLNSLSS
jgi:hypothetical protein